jgi:peptidoglycan LD-endopeptidase CwlK
MPNQWSNRSQLHYDTLHPDLQVMCDTVLVYHDCSILYGHRDKNTQNSLYNDGKSKLKYPQSKHNALPSEAVDLIPYRKGYNPYGNASEARYGSYFCGLVLGIADRLYAEGEMSMRIRWGGNWSTQRNKPFAKFYDGYHFELFRP